ncbi:hypothetical protein AMATHDRAFT_78650 [Amanita thiersii Skay4041]|uniref:Sugar phosphate transporter domain-containing protein n=1 Tax=Amanita thiersii Skay4041 TaxID=703135 RepID=A0A2A9P076_9AGAR|nr:hypothetical protein AMATHDRAFT_78650 [Amanita thiersii Skay4041]
MVFGGCCTNAWTYEQLLIMSPQIGSALTFSQMLFITTQSLPSFLSFTDSRRLPRLKPRTVPLAQWMLQVLMLTASSLLINWAYAYRVPLTVLIVFRSAGLAVSMLLGYLFLNKQYTPLQVLCVAVVSIGVVLATLSRPVLPSASGATQDDVRLYITGVSMLIMSSILTGILGLLQEITYKTYGPCWKEGVFYTHLLSLPLFVFLSADIKRGISSLLGSNTTTSFVMSLTILAGNLVSQLVCVSGVNRMTSRVSSVSTNLVLTARKALSLCLSVWWFGNGWNVQLSLGAVMVFLGSICFGLTTREKPKVKVS